MNTNKKLNKEGQSLVCSMIQGILVLAQKKLGDNELPNFEKFVQAYYRSVADEEMEGRAIEDLFGIAYSHFLSLANRKPGEINLNVYNPNLETHGWQSRRTVIQLTQDDMPFLIDTMVMELNRMGINMHFILHTSYFRVLRTPEGLVSRVFGLENFENSEDVEKINSMVEAPVYIEIDRQEDDPKVLKNIQKNLAKALGDVRLAVSDYKLMRMKLAESVQSLELNLASYQKEEVLEAIDFLTWLDNNHFTYLGYAEFLADQSSSKNNDKNNQDILSINNAKTLGILHHSERFQEGNFLGSRSKAYCLDLNQPVLVAKSDFESTVHRRGRMDVIVLSLFNSEGQRIGERRFVGLFTSIAYHSNPVNIPLIRLKAKLTLQESSFDMNGHAGKALVNILQNFPRDELFHIDQAQLLKISLGILNIQERQKLRLFIIQDPLRRYFSCMVYLPRDLFNTDLRLKIQHILLYELEGQEVQFEPIFFDSSVLCRIDFLVHAKSAKNLDHADIKNIEAKLIIAARDWRDDLRLVLIEQFGEHQGSLLHSKYARAFPAGYREAFMGPQAALDISYIEAVLKASANLSKEKSEDKAEIKAANNYVGMCFYRLLEEADNHIRFKLFHQSEPIPLTVVLPILENMGLSVMEERPYEIKVGEETVWISDFGMRLQGSLVQPEEISEIFKESFSSVWEKHAENDGFNRLVMRAGLSWREISILRAYAKYLIQIGFLYSQNYIEDCLSENPEVSRELVKFFISRFNPALSQRAREENYNQAESRILKLLEAVTNIDKDRILRKFLEVMKATLRTNYFQQDSKKLNQPHAYISFKLQSDLISNMPKPLPLYEIFVSATYMEGVHLRGSKVARGGLRWSEREDFRREVLGLLKAQQVKNAVIVPFGAKGGFISKCLPKNGTRQEVFQEVTRCYKTFISGMLDITDNRDGEKIIPPKDVIRYDQDDPYFVVAADKGTATFSDTANAVAKEYNFWLGDAFASGGSNGYDHKKMGITARGAWESAKRHFLTLGKNIMAEDFTCAGIGDMSGDVFGNGMLLSPHIKLLAAFDHRHIFIDPNPDAKTSFEERKRLFNLERSSWQDYNPELISEGGGVFERAAKSITLSPEAAKLFKLKNKKVEPNELIQAILKMRVELLFNGGIGTYIKASTENNFMIGDRSNDDVRVDASDLKAKVLVEGGNVGVTQLARIEFAQRGGLIYTDAIDNSAGVDCSDHEVNIKILLADAINSGLLKPEDRNNLLAQMRDDVASLVLSNNYHQTQAISNMRSSSPDVLYMQLRLIRELEREGFLDRKLEFLPSDKDIKARFSSGLGLTAPELSILMAYSKTAVKGEIFKSKLPDEPYFDCYLAAEFPQVLTEKFGSLMRRHYLCREIIVTQLTNEMLEQMGIGFVHRLYDETGATPALIARAYVIAKEICELPEMWSKIESLDGKVDMSMQQELMNDVVRLVRRVSRWLLQNNRINLDVPELISFYKSKINDLRNLMSKLLSKDDRNIKKDFIKKYSHSHVPNELALKASDYAFMSPFMDIIHVASEHDLDYKDVAEVFYKLGDELEISWFHQSVGSLREEGYWGTLSSSELRDDMDRLQTSLSISVLLMTDKNLDLDARVSQWIESFKYMVNRWLYMIQDLKGSNKNEFIMYLVAMRGLLDLSQNCIAKMALPCSEMSIDD